MKLATVELSVPGTNHVGRALLDRELLSILGLEELERRFAADFADAEDEARLVRIENVLRASDTLRVDVHPGEAAPPEYHVYFRDPADSEARLFACVLAPEAVTEALLQEPPHLLFENATFQAMSNDTSTAGLLCAVEIWVQRIFPEIALPSIVLRPWPIIEVAEDLGARASPKGPLVGVLPVLETSDYPIPQELSA